MSWDAAPALRIGDEAGTFAAPVAQEAAGRLGCTAWTVAAKDRESLSVPAGDALIGDALATASALTLVSCNGGVVATTAILNETGPGDPLAGLEPDTPRAEPDASVVVDVVAVSVKEPADCSTKVAKASSGFDRAPPRAGRATAAAGVAVLDKTLESMNRDGPGAWFKRFCARVRQC